MGKGTIRICVKKNMLTGEYRGGCDIDMKAVDGWMLIKSYNVWFKQQIKYKPFQSELSDAQKYAYIMNGNNL
jgi:hypothetical protein